MKDNLQNFNASQREAICHGDGPALVLAGPGSGKTTVITRRLVYLTGTLGIPPENITVVTFTKAAAMEMQQRFHSLAGAGLMVRFGTFHALYYHILRNSQSGVSLTLIKETEKQAFLRQILRSQRLDPDLAPAFSEEFGRLKTGSPQNPAAIGTASPEQVLCIFQTFRNRCRESGKLDFDDMAYECLRMFEDRPDILRRWQKQCRYILADEYQDASPIQDRILSMLALPENNLFLVGDDDQSIYGFRGAGTELMLSFPRRYPQARQIYLEMNYRCRPGIIRAAETVIRENKTRFEKKQIPARESSGSKEVVCRGFADQDAENREILRILQEAGRRGRLADTAVLFRRHADGTALMSLLERHHIPMICMEQEKSLYDHYVTKDVTAYLKLMHGDRSRKEFYRVMNRPNRGIAREGCMGERVDFAGLLRYHAGEQETERQIKKLERDFVRAGGMSLYAAVMYLRKGMGYEAWLRQEYQGTMLEQAMRVLGRLQELAGRSADIGQWNAHLEAGKQTGKSGRASEKSREAVFVLTCHGAKGLEFDHVILPDLNEGSIPHKKAVTEQEIEEERRILYVGMTRARERLSLFYRTGTKEEPEIKSRFLQVL